MLGESVATVVGEMEWVVAVGDEEGKARMDGEKGGLEEMERGGRGEERGEEDERGKRGEVMRGGRGEERREENEEEGMVGKLTGTAMSEAYSEDMVVGVRNGEG